MISKTSKDLNEKVEEHELNKEIRDRIKEIIQEEEIKNVLNNEIICEPNDDLKKKLNINYKIKNKEDYLKLYEFAKNYDHTKFLKETYNFFGWLFNKDDLDYIAKYLQICIKGSRPLYLHGYIVSSALYKYIHDSKNIEYITILETGTARGFADIVMGEVLRKYNIKGKIHTIDHLNHEKNLNWNCIDAPNGGKISRHKILERWSYIRDNYINFINGDSNEVLMNLNIGRINFAFLDGPHNYKELFFELNYVEKNQKSGDIIICDDYTITQFPEICKAIDEFLSYNKYESTFFYGYDGTKKRGYVYMKKK